MAEGNPLRSTGFHQDAPSHASASDPRQSGTRVRNDWIGREFDGRYRILDLLDDGGMSTVFLAEHMALEKPVAFKVVRGGLAGTGELQLAREALASARLEHPNVASANDCGLLPEGGVYFVMQFARGASLRTALREHGALHWRRACEIAAQIADALCAAETAGIIHRDLKPHNIMLEERDDGSDLVMILDFGIAHVIGREASRLEDATLERECTRVGMVVGTPGYMAPEQAVGAKLDHRCDLYALGVVLWEMLAGRKLWEGRDPAAVITRQLREEAPLLSAMAPDPHRPEPLDRLLRSLLDRDPDGRPRRALDVRDALRGLVDLPAPGDVTVRVQRSARPALGWRWAVALVAGFAVGWGVVAWRGDQLPRPSPKPVASAALPPTAESLAVEAVNVAPAIDVTSAREGLTQPSAPRAVERPVPARHHRATAAVRRSRRQAASRAAHAAVAGRARDAQVPRVDTAGAAASRSSAGGVARPIAGQQPASQQPVARAEVPAALLVSSQPLRLVQAEVQTHDLAVRGSLAPSVVRRALQRVEPQLRACQQARTDAGRSPIELDVQVEFDERGRVIAPHVTSAGGAALNACVADATRRIALSVAPDTGVVRAGWKLTLLAQ